MMPLCPETALPKSVTEASGFVVAESLTSLILLSAHATASLADVHELKEGVPLGTDSLYKPRVGKVARGKRPRRPCDRSGS